MKKLRICPTLFFVCLVFVLISAIFLLGCKEEKQTLKEQAPIKPMEKPRVEGLKEFHEVLYPVWHSYLPKGDYQAIRKAVPAFKKSVEILMKAPLPDFYQHVKDDFESKRQNLVLSVEELDSVAQTGDDKKLENTVENMHSAFEQMARVLAPRIKEIEEFHLVLYPLWHYAMPQKDYPAIKTAIPSLESRMDALMKAQLPESSKNIESQFLEKREALKKTVEELAEVCHNNKDTEIIEKLTRMHEYYRNLDEVFE